MSKRYTVTRNVLVKQATVVKANSSDEAIKLSKSLKYKAWGTENAERSGYTATVFQAE